MKTTRHGRLWWGEYCGRCYQAQSGESMIPRVAHMIMDEFLVNVEGGSVRVVRLRMATTRSVLQACQADIHSANHHQVRPGTMPEENQAKVAYADPLRWICSAPGLPGSWAIQLWPSMDTVDIPKESRRM